MGPGLAVALVGWALPTRIRMVGDAHPTGVLGATGPAWGVLPRDERGGVRAGVHRAPTFPPGRAKGFRFDPPARGPLQTVCEVARPDARGRSIGTALEGQVFWLSAPRGRPSRLLFGSGSSLRPRAWPITAA